MKVAMKPYYVARLIVSFLVELALSNIAVARVVLRPRLDIRPGIVAFRTTLHSDLAITFLANMITLTPGTLTIDVSEERSTLYIHTLNVSDPEEVVADIRRAFERHLLELEK